jgi:hypothetical protein
MAILEKGHLTEQHIAVFHEFAGQLLKHLHATRDTQDAMCYIFDVLKLQVVLGVDPAGNCFARMCCLVGSPTSSIPPVPTTITMLLPSGQRQQKRKHEACSERS